MPIIGPYPTRDGGAQNLHQKAAPVQGKNLLFFCKFLFGLEAEIAFAYTVKNVREILKESGAKSYLRKNCYA